MSKKAGSGYVLAFDFGLRNIGVGIGQSVTRTARGIATLKAKDGKPNWREVRALAAEYGPSRCVVGLPLNMDGSTSNMTDRATHFGDELFKRLHVEVALHDERLTSRSAKTGMDEAKAIGSASTEHELAACLILESWFRACD